MSRAKPVTTSSKVTPKAPSNWKDRIQPEDYEELKNTNEHNALADAIFNKKRLRVGLNIGIVCR